MNIYITRDNEKALREYKGTMSGLVNTLLDDYRKQIEQGYGTLAQHDTNVKANLSQNFLRLKAQHDASWVKDNTVVNPKFEEPTLIPEEGM